MPTATKESRDNTKTSVAIIVAFFVLSFRSPSFTERRLSLKKLFQGCYGHEHVSVRRREIELNRLIERHLALL
jgi:hypothetical protein